MMKRPPPTPRSEALGAGHSRAGEAGCDAIAIVRCIIAAPSDRPTNLYPRLVSWLRCHPRYRWR